MIVTKKREEEEQSVVLEINLISAQGLKLPTSVTGRRVKTYALAWVDPAAKLRTGIDRDGGDNPTWNDRFLFRVSPEFLSGETSGVFVEIYAVGRIRDSLVGTVRFLIGNFLDVRSKTPSFTALQIRRPSSGSFHGVLNIGATVFSISSSSDLMAEKIAVGYRDLMAAGSLSRRRRDRRKKEAENLNPDGDEFSDGGWSSSSSSSSSMSAWTMAMKDLNSMRDFAPNQCAGFLCGLVLQRGIVQAQSRPFDRDDRTIKVVGDRDRDHSGCLNKER